MDQQSPITRLSLVGRLKNTQDHDAWVEFIAIYEPLILRILQQHQLQEHDSRDVCQQVLAAVAKDIEQWQPDGSQRSFRRWLFRIARNRVLKFLTRERKMTLGAGGSQAQMALLQQQDNHAVDSSWFDRECRQQLLLRAAELIQKEFRASTWEAFWKSYIDGDSIPVVAERLGMSIGSVYVARSRIVARLRTKVREITDEIGDPLE